MLQRKEEREKGAERGGGNAVVKDMARIRAPTPAQHNAMTLNNALTPRALRGARAARLQLRTYHAPCELGRNLGGHVPGITRRVTSGVRRELAG